MEMKCLCFNYNSKKRESVEKFLKSNLQCIFLIIWKNQDYINVNVRAD